MNRKETSSAPKEVGKTDFQEGKEVRLSKKMFAEGKKDVMYTRNKIFQAKEKGLFYRTCERLKYCITEKGVFLKKETA